MAHGLPMASREIGDNVSFARVSPVSRQHFAGTPARISVAPVGLGRTACPKKRARP
jgi:hypothetical protein